MDAAEIYAGARGGKGGRSLWRTVQYAAPTRDRNCAWVGGVSGSRTGGDGRRTRSVVGDWLPSDFRRGNDRGDDGDDRDPRVADRLHWPKVLWLGRGDLSGVRITQRRLRTFRHVSNHDCGRPFFRRAGMDTAVT